MQCPCAAGGQPPLLHIFPGPQGTAGAPPAYCSKLVPLSKSVLHFPVLLYILGMFCSVSMGEGTKESSSLI